MREILFRYKGLLYTHCDKCGRQRGWRAGRPTTEDICRCGNVIRLEYLRPADVRCTCGRKSTYRTNIRDAFFKIPCPDCRRPVNMALNDGETGFVTVGVPEQRNQNDIKNGDGRA